MATTHHVKSWTYLFDAIKSGKKTHDIRNITERDYKIGDFMLLQRFDQVAGKYTGEELLVEITYKTDNETPCALSSACLDRKYGVLSVKIVQ